MKDITPEALARELVYKKWRAPEDNSFAVTPLYTFDVVADIAAFIRRERTAIARELRKRGQLGDVPKSYLDYIAGIVIARNRKPKKAPKR